MTVSREDLALLTDLYELTMAQSYFQAGRTAPATFSLFIRKYPPNRGYFVSCGLEDVLRYLEDLRFGPEAIDYLHQTGIFADEFLDYLKGLRFAGDVWAIPEGRLFFLNEPIVEVTAPVIEAQVVESFIINQVNLQSMIATKASRCVYAARGREVVDFSLRRTQGIDAGMKVARASYIAGFFGSSNVLAGKVYGIPIVGTVAHSFITSFPQEIEAFRSFVRSFPERSTLLIDTYDTVAGAHKAVQVAREMAARGERLSGVRIDSGNLPSLGKKVRRILDRAGLQHVQIVGSGGLDEWDLDRFSRHGAPYNSYGVGTHMGVSADAPFTDIAYKLVRYADRPVLKLSTGKVSLPDDKQVFRFSGNGRPEYDIIALRSEHMEGGEAMLKKCMAGGRMIPPMPSLDEIRGRFLSEFGKLDERYKAITKPDTYPVALSPGLEALARKIERQVAEVELSGPRRRHQ